MKFSLKKNQIRIRAFIIKITIKSMQ